MTRSLKIRGIVKTATTAKNMLKVGIKSCEIDNFQQYIQNSINSIEKICNQANTHPDELPTRSRNAYYFLKEIDLNNLPILNSKTESIPVKESTPTIGIKNIVTQEKIILNDIFNLAQGDKSSELQRLINNIENNVKIIEDICQNNQLTPSNLSNSARPIYAWLKFLTNPFWLEKHIFATRNAHKIAKKINQTHSLDWRNIFIAFKNMKSLYKARKNQYQYQITLNEGFINADEEIIKKIMTTIFKGQNSHSNKVIKQYAVTEEYSNIILALDLNAEMEVDNPEGQYYDLNLLFERINSSYFGKSLSKPRLSWSKCLTTRKFGHYESNRDRVVISLTLDNINIPMFVPEFVLYHELLHKHCGEKWIKGQRRVHTPEFKQLERQFELYQEAEAWLTKLAHIGSIY